MSLFDVFKKKPEEKIEKNKGKKPAIKAGKVDVTKKSKSKLQKPKAKKIEQKTKPVKKEAQEVKKQTKTSTAHKALKGSDAWKSLSAPHVTEKATALAGHNQYIFKVFKQVNKREIKEAVEALYGVNVEKVRIINVHRKKRRMGRTQGFKKGYKKAIVKIKQGQEIEILPR